MAWPSKQRMKRIFWLFNRLFVCATVCIKKKDKSWTIKSVEGKARLWQCNKIGVSHSSYHTECNSFRLARGLNSLRSFHASILKFAPPGNSETPRTHAHIVQQQIQTLSLIFEPFENKVCPLTNTLTRIGHTSEGNNHIEETLPSA